MNLWERVWCMNGIRVVRPSSAESRRCRYAATNKSHVVMVSQPQVVTDVIVRASEPAVAADAMSSTDVGTGAAFGWLSQVDAGDLNVGNVQAGPPSGPRSSCSTFALTTSTATSRSRRHSHLPGIA